MDVRVKFLRASGAVTGSRFLLEIEEKVKNLIDRQKTL